MSSLDRRAFLKTTAASLAVVPASRALPAPSDEDPLGVRRDFPITDTLTYLNTASRAPFPRAVRDASVAFADVKMRTGFAANRDEIREEARERFAALFGAKPEEIGILYSTSDGENIVASALDLGPGDNVVIDELHFVTSFVLYRELEKNKGIELRIVPQRDGRSDLEDFDARIDAKTKLVSVAWVSNRNGFREDVRGLADLAHRKGAFLYTDAVQAIGAFQTNLTEEGVDFATTNANKWLYASYGAAPFFVREELIERIHPDRYGHGSPKETLDNHHYRLRTTASKYEYAAPAYNIVYQLNAGLGYLKEVGLDRIEKHTIALAHELRDGLANLGLDIWTPPNNNSPIVSFAHGRDTDEMKKLFDKEGIVVTFREKEGSVIRSSVSLFNNRADVQKLLKVLATVA
jgi:cysteine desulfurase/selenocysteine lyase